MGVLVHLLLAMKLVMASGHVVLVESSGKRAPQLSGIAGTKQSSQVVLICMVSGVLSDKNQHAIIAHACELGQLFTAVPWDGHQPFDMDHMVQSATCDKCKHWHARGIYPGDGFRAHCHQMTCNMHIYLM